MLNSKGLTASSDGGAGRQRCKEAYKFGQDNVSHAIVYDAEAFHPRIATFEPKYRQHYLRGDTWIELYFRVEISGHPCEYVAVLSAARNGPVLVNTVQHVQQGEGIGPRLIPIPSFVRLYRIYDSFDIGLNVGRDVKEWWERRDKREFIERLIRIELTDHACWVERFIHSDVLVNGFQVLICPLELQDRPFEGMRLVSVDCD